MKPSEMTTVELLEEIAVWVTVDAPPEPFAASLYAGALRERAARLRESLTHFAALVKDHPQSMYGGSFGALVAINEPSAPTTPEGTPKS